MRSFRQSEVHVPCMPGPRSQAEKTLQTEACGATRNLPLAGGKPQELKPGLQGAGSVSLKQAFCRVRFGTNEQLTGLSI